MLINSMKRTINGRSGINCIQKLSQLAENQVELIGALAQSALHSVLLRWLTAPPMKADREEWNKLQCAHSTA